MEKIRSMAFGAIAAAIAFIFLYMSSALPSGRMVCLCISTACICVTVMQGGIKSGFLASTVLNVLGYFIVPDKLTVILFIMFFSYYPMLKLWFERRSSIAFEWILKVIFFACVSIISIFAILFFDLVPQDIENILKDNKILVLAVAICSACAAVFDYALSLIISFYAKQIMPKLNKN